MKILFIHQNFPGQYVHLARAMAAEPGCTVVGLGEKKVRPPFNYPVLTYDPPKGPSDRTHHYLRGMETQVRRGQQVFRLCREMQRSGFVPDVVCGHPGWGEMLFVRDAFPQARQLVYCEFFYRASGSDVGFDPEFPADVDSLLAVRMRNTVQLHALSSCDAGISPMPWQHDQYPEEYKPRIHVQHDGIDTDAVAPKAGVSLALGPDKPILTGQDAVVTYVARNLEPYRGFHSFMRAIPHIQRVRPDVHFVVIGGDEVSYGRRPPNGESYRERYLREIALDQTRVHFLGRVPYSIYLNALAISSAHVYLTYPFVLSWSCLEAMSLGCPVIASRTAPVLDVIEDGVTGVLADFFSPEDIAEQVLKVLDNRDWAKTIRKNARNIIRDRFDLHAVALPALKQLIRELV